MATQEQNVVEDGPRLEFSDEDLGQHGLRRVGKGLELIDKSPEGIRRCFHSFVGCERRLTPEESEARKRELEGKPQSYILRKFGFDEE
jgi:hypothetical protein